jgi:hypothetical protein
MSVLEQALTSGQAVSELLPAEAKAATARHGQDAHATHGQDARATRLAQDQARIAGQLTGPRYQDAGRRIRRAMGLLMADWRGRVSGADAARGMAAALEKVNP